MSLIFYIYFPSNKGLTRVISLFISYPQVVGDTLEIQIRYSPVNGFILVLTYFTVCVGFAVRVGGSCAVSYLAVTTSPNPDYKTNTILYKTALDITFPTKLTLNNALVASTRKLGCISTPLNPNKSLLINNKSHLPTPHVYTHQQHHPISP